MFPAGIILYEKRKPKLLKTAIDISIGKVLKVKEVKRRMFKKIVR